MSLTNTLVNASDEILQIKSEVEQMVKDNEKLNDDIQRLEKEQAEGWLKFNTETHFLMEKEELTNILDKLDDAKYEAESAEDEAGSARDSADNASYSANSVRESCQNIRANLEDLMPSEEEEEVTE
tara:strand:- start:1141 stop:1518 length:378 start_codon:yes stop_codon:yes gene_type:complete